MLGMESCSFDSSGRVSGISFKLSTSSLGACNPSSGSGVKNNGENCLSEAE